MSTETDTQPLAEWEIELADAEIADLSAHVPCDWFLDCDVPATWVGVAKPHPHPSDGTFCPEHHAEIVGDLSAGRPWICPCEIPIDRVMWRPL